MFRLLVTVVASAAMLQAPALAAAASPASSAQPTAIVGLASSVSDVGYQQPVTFTGELASIDGGSSVPVPDEPVQIEIRPGGEHVFLPVATGTTGSDGRFTITTTLPSGGNVRAAFAGDGGLDPASSDIAVGAVRVPSRLVLGTVPRSVPAGTPVTFSGTIQVQVNGSWQPFHGFVPLTLTAQPDTSGQPSAVAETTSGPAGEFSMTEPVSQTGQWAVDTSRAGNVWPDWFPDWAQASYGTIEGVSRTRVIGFSFPATEEAHRALAGGLDATGTAQRWNGSSWVGLAVGAVQLYYRPKGSATWRKDHSGGQTGASGTFRIAAGIHLGTSRWRARVMPAPDTLTSTSGSVTSTITDRTNFALAQIRRSSSGSSISGQVTDWHNGQHSFSSLRGLKLRLYERPDGSKTWHSYESTKTGSDGWFAFSAAKSYGYKFKVVLPAQGPFLPCTSRIL